MNRKITRGLLSLTIIFATCFLCLACGAKKADQTSAGIGADVGIWSKRVAKAFKKVKVGDAEKKGKGGTTIEQLKSIFSYEKNYPMQHYGDDTVDGKSTDGYVIWQYQQIKGKRIAYCLEFQVLDKRVVSKSTDQDDLLLAKKLRKKKDFRQIPAGTSLKDVINKYGRPNFASEYYENGQKHLEIGWVTKHKNNTSLLCDLDFVNGKLTRKSSI